MFEMVSESPANKASKSNDPESSLGTSSPRTWPVAPSPPTDSAVAPVAANSRN